MTVSSPPGETLGFGSAAFRFGLRPWETAATAATGLSLGDLLLPAAASTMSPLLPGCESLPPPPLLEDPRWL